MTKYIQASILPSLLLTGYHSHNDVEKLLKTLEKQRDQLCIQRVDIFIAEVADDMFQINMVFIESEDAIAFKEAYFA